MSFMVDKMVKSSKISEISLAFENPTTPVTKTTPKPASHVASMRQSFMKKQEDVTLPKPKTKPEDKPDIKSKPKPLLTPKPQNDMKIESKSEKIHDKPHKVDEKKIETPKVFNKPKPSSKFTTPNNFHSLQHNRNDKPKVNCKINFNEKLVNSKESLNEKLVNSKESLNEKPVNAKNTSNEKPLSRPNFLNKKPVIETTFKDNLKNDNKSNINNSLPKTPISKPKPDLTKQEPKDKVKSEPKQNDSPKLPARNNQTSETKEISKTKSPQPIENEIKYEGIDGLFYVKLNIEKETSKAPRKPAKPPNVSHQSLLALINEDNNKEFENSSKNDARNSCSDESFGIREEWEEEEEELQRMKEQEADSEMVEEEFYEEL